MLIGTCDACHETAPFADYLAGLTVQCKKCGVGWVRVAVTAAGITASIPAHAEKGEPNPPDTAVTAQRPPARGAALEVPLPAPGTCPRCGCAAFKRLKAKKGTALQTDRECKDCGTPYMTIPAPLSDAARTAIYISGALLILGGILVVLVRLGEVHGPGATFSPLYAVLFSVVLGYRVFSMPQQVHQLREKRLKAYRSSALPGTPPPVEVPRPPDMVFLSVMFGTLALTSPLVSALLLVVLFGPAAVVCGAIALGQGHLKGLVGILLGLLGLIAWGALFLLLASLFQG